MANLKTEVAGISFPNPFILSAGPPTARQAMVIKAFEAGWGGAVLKTIGLYPTKHPSPRIHHIKSGRNQAGLLDIELISDLTLDRWEKEIDTIREAFPDRPLIASIMGGGNPHEWQEVIRRIEPHGVDGFEMNASCPSYSEKKGSKLGQDPAALGQAVKWVRDATDIPVIVKLTPNVTDIVDLARVATAAGASALTCGNSLTGIGGIDLESFTPLPAIKGKGIVGGYGGPGLKPVSLRCTANVSQAMLIPIFGCGGIEKWQDAAEYLTVGASAVQVCTAVMCNGIQIIADLTAGLARYLNAHGFACVADIIGKALPSLCVWTDLDLGWRRVAAVDEELCNGCGLCINACDSGGFQAIRIQAEKAYVDSSRCDGCGLCPGICPQEAIRLLPGNKRKV